MDKFKNKASAYILSHVFVFKWPSTPLSLVFSNREVEGRSYHNFGEIHFGIPPLSHTMVSSFCPLSNSASGMAKSRAEGLKERCWAETLSLTVREATGRAAGTYGDTEPLESPHCALMSR